MFNRKGKLKRALALALSTVTLSMSVIPYLPPNLLTAYAFGLVFVNSGVSGSPYLKGRVDGESTDSWFLCLNHGAPASGWMDYSKINADVSYSEGSMDQKRLLWAYIGAFGSYDGDDTVRPYVGAISKDAARHVAWKETTVPWVEQKINEFATLESVPEGAKSAKDILDTVMTYNTPEKAISIGALQVGPGEIGSEKLWQLAGLKSMEYFNKYCTVEPVSEPIEIEGRRYEVVVNNDGANVYCGWGAENGYIYPGDKDKLPDAIVRVKYDPAIFKVLSAEGRIEYFKAKNAPSSQQLARAKMHIDTTFPEFYITSGAGNTPPVPGGGEGGGGGSLDGGEGIEVKIYKHEETFESNYKVDLTKKDYETGNELKDATWQVLEAFPDQTKLADNELDGNLVEENMREDPTTWL